MSKAFLKDDSIVKELQNTYFNFALKASDILSAVQSEVLVHANKIEDLVVRLEQKKNEAKAESEKAYQDYCNCKNQYSENDEKPDCSFEYKLYSDALSHYHECERYYDEGRSLLNDFKNYVQTSLNSSSVKIEKNIKNAQNAVGGINKLFANLEGYVADGHVNNFEKSNSEQTFNKMSVFDFPTLSVPHNVADNEVFTQDDFETIGRYTNEHPPLYEKLNKGLREGKLSKELSNYKDKLNSTLDKLENYEGQSYRGTNLNNENVDKYRQAFLNNEIIEESAFTSSSKDLKTAYFFSGGKEKNKVFFTIESKTGKNIVDASTLKRENEVLFKSSTNFKVVDFKQTVDTVFINLKEV